MAITATYRDMFNETLEEQIAAGGEVSSVVTVVNAYQKFDPIARQFLFQDWLVRDFICTRCSAPFQPNPDDVEEEHYVLCRRCS